MEETTSAPQLPFKTSLPLLGLPTSAIPTALQVAAVMAPLNVQIRPPVRPLFQTFEPAAPAPIVPSPVAIVEPEKAASPAAKQPRKRKSASNFPQTEAESLQSSPMQRGKYGLRMMPPQVDYYQVCFLQKSFKCVLISLSPRLCVQSMLEDQKAKVIKESLRPSDSSASAKSSTDESEVTELPVKRGRRAINPPAVSPPKSPTKTKASTSASMPSPSKTIAAKKPEAPTKDAAVGEIVWATLPSYKFWFPGLVIANHHCGQRPAKPNHTWVYWFGDHQVSEINKAKVKPFVFNFVDMTKSKSSLTTLRMKEALQILASRAGLSLPQNTPTSEDEALIEWAKNGFQVKASQTASTSKKLSADPFAPDPSNPIPGSVACYLPLDALFLQQLKTNDDRSQQIAFFEVESAQEPENAEEEDTGPVHLPEFRAGQVDRVRRAEIGLGDICLACGCDHNPVADQGVDGRRLQHPLFEGILCKQCLETVRTTGFAPGEDDKNVSLLFSKPWPFSCN